MKEEKENINHSLTPPSSGVKNGYNLAVEFLEFRIKTEGSHAKLRHDPVRAEIHILSCL